MPYTCRQREHVSTTALDRRQAKHGRCWPWDLACTAACREPPRPMDSPRLCVRSTTTCTVLTQTFVSTAAAAAAREPTTRQARHRVHAAAARRTIPLCPIQKREEKIFISSSATCSPSISASLNHGTVDPIMTLTLDRCLPSTPPGSVKVAL